MKRIVEYPAGGGAKIVAEVEEASIGMVPAASPGDLIAHAQKSFEEVLASIKPATDTLAGTLKNLDYTPDEFQIEFGLKLGFEASAIIASGTTDANFKITLKWDANKKLE